MDPNNGIIKGLRCSHLILIFVLLNLKSLDPYQLTSTPRSE